MIQGLPNKFPSQMTEEDKAKDMLMIVSHPGWQRNSYWDYQERMNSQHRAKIRRFGNIVNKKENLFRMVLIDEQNYYDIYKELVTEEAISFGKKEGYPMAATVRCTKDNGYKITDFIEGHFQTYLQNLLHKSMYVIPTEEKSGFIDVRRVTESFSLTEEEENILGDCIHIKDIIFSGGYKVSCIKNTSRYFKACDNERKYMYACDADDHNFKISQKDISQLLEAYDKDQITRLDFILVLDSRYTPELFKYAT